MFLFNERFPLNMLLSFYKTGEPCGVISPEGHLVYLLSSCAISVDAKDHDTIMARALARLSEKYFSVFCLSTVLARAEMFTTSHYSSTHLGRI